MTRPPTRRPRPAGGRVRQPRTGPAPRATRPNAEAPVAASLRTVRVPQALEVAFLRAQDYVARYFSERTEDPGLGTIVISGERYVLLRAASLSVEFFDLVTSLYRDQGGEQARSVATNLLFDLAHAIGKADARAFHESMGVSDPIEKLSAGPIHFSFSGWAFVDILPESNPSPDESFCLVYDHPYSFESATWLRRGRRSDRPVCVMNAGYSSGWCEESFAQPLVASEIECQAAGGARCRFVMAPPATIEQQLARHVASTRRVRGHRRATISVPEFFQRKRMEEQLRRSHDELEHRVEERTAELLRTNERLRLEVAVRRRAEQARDQFLSVAAHELKTPLTSLRGFAQLLTQQLSRGSPDPGTLGFALTAIDNQCDKLTRLVGQLLDVSRLEGGQLAIQRERTDVMALAASAIEAARARSDRHTLSLDGPATLDAFVDPLRLEQVFTNLLDNALKYSPDGGPIEVALAADVDSVTISVTDVGIGIPVEHGERVFERFHQVDPDGGQGGLGMGLFISRQIVELHGGTLRLEPAPGRGTRFVARIPRGTVGTP